MSTDGRSAVWNLCRRRWLWMPPLAILLLVGLYAAVGHWLAPRIIRSLAIDYVAGELGNSLSLGEVHVDPFALRLDIADARIANGHETLVALRRLEVDLSASTLWRSGYVFDGITLEAPYAHAVIREDGSLNLLELLPEADGSDAPLPELWIRHLEVAEGRIDFADHSRHARPEARLAPIAFQLDDFRSTIEGGRFRLTAASARDERFEWTGQLSLQPLASEGTMTIGDLRSATIQDFVGELLPFRLSDGQVGFATDYRFSAVRGEGIRLDASIPELRAQALVLRTRDDDNGWIRLPETLVEDVQLSLHDREMKVGAVHVRGAQADVWREPDGTLNLERLLAGPAQQAAASDVAAAGDGIPGSWKVEVAGFHLDGGSLNFQDRTVRPVADFRLSPLSAGAKGISLVLEAPIEVQLETMVNDAAALSVSGTIIPATLAATLEVEMSKLPLRDLSAYLPLPSQLTLGAGAVAGAGTLVLRPPGESGPNIEFSGWGTVDGVAMVDARSGDRLLSWRRVLADGLRYTMSPDSLAIRTLEVQAPSARIAVLPDGSVNLVDALGDAGPTVTTTQGQAGMPIRVDRVAVNGGSLGFSDRSIEPNFSADIEALRGTVTGISNGRGQVAKIDLGGHVINRHSPVEIVGETDFSAYDRHTDVRMAFRNIELPIFNPYSGRFAGYAISKGKLTTEFHYRIDERALLADHHVVVDQLEWGEATDSKDKVSLPVRLATSLLKDRHGVIELDLPVTGSIDDPKFRIGPVVWQVMVNIITKAVTAPFSLLGSLFEGAENARYIDFAPGASDLTNQSAMGLAALAKGLAEKTELKLDIPGAMAGKLDADALRDRRMHKALAAEAGIAADAFDDTQLEPEDKLDLLRDLYRRQYGHKPDLPEAPTGSEMQDRSERRAARQSFEIAWLESQLRLLYEPKDEELEALGKARAAAVQDALLAGDSIDPARLFLALNQGTADHEGMARMELQLK